MSARIEAWWEARPDAYGPRRHRRPCRYEAYVPDLLAELRLALDAESAADLADAERALAVFDARAHSQHDLEKLARFLLRAEAVASSKIEGLHVNTRRLARHEAERERGRRSRLDATAEAVLGNVGAMVLAVDKVATADAVTTGHILDVHRELMTHSERPDLAGQVRTEQNWIGGSDFNPCSAAFVPPPPDRVPALLEDLCAFLNRDDLPAVVQAGLIHAQFETIHPFADGNGRTGRALIHVVLRRRAVTTSFVPPISLVLATQASTYVAGLMAYRYDGPPDSAAARDGIQRWLDVFVAAATRAAADATALCERMVELERRWREQVRPRRGSAADRVLPHLVSHPMLSVADVVDLLGVTRPAAAQAVDHLVNVGVLSQVSTGARNRLFEARGVFEVLTNYERALATASGDTRIAQPRRPVPYRRGRDLGS